MSYRGRSTFFVIIERFIDSLKPKNLKSNVKLIGDDYLGNKYFESHAKQLFDRRIEPKRWFEPKREDLWDQPLPPEWNAWLRMRRTDPPTTEEIEYNLMVERKKKEMNETTKAPKTDNKFNSFPTYEEYDDFSGMKDSLRNKDKT
ncbi:unnamed protein product [Medioppia subpectinata]|uniref:NADH dehydrogenase [ubiquinone] 1 alpha subcomplex subunit 12 n=1 Tax=Medioppia subpectinata TaxID=1979941 RepID=A0A7R9LIZ0_9ACAR|nr:unnamed protein product [Medioppia subpectinata]CAG2118888.1 unnamed protein product [Medioppia subpectinata]